MDPLSVTASIVGLLTAGCRMVSLLRNIALLRDTPQSVTAVLREVESITQILKSLEQYLDGEAIPLPDRLSLILVEEVQAILTGCVLTYSNLTPLLDSIGLSCSRSDASRASASIFNRLRWLIKEREILGFIQQLNGFKSSLSLMLTIIQCQSMREVENSMNALSNLVYEILQSNEDLAGRFNSIQDNDSSLALTVRNCADLQSGAATAGLRNLDINQDSGLTRHQYWINNMPFEKDLQNSRVYKRVACRSSALSLTDSARLRGMSSLFSDTTLDKVSKVSFISLPVSYKELTNSDCYETKAVSCRSLSNQGNPEGSHQREHDIFRSLVAPKADEILVVGVHVGMKSTAVSYVKIPYETEDYAMHILEWPGSNDRLVRRVPTAVTYEVGRRRNISWGFECPADCNVGSSRAVRDRFTAYLDPRMLSLAHQALTKDKFESLEDVEMWFEDFLRSLYKHTARSLTEFFKIDDWRTYKVEYAFSVPTVWEDSGTVISFFRAILERAGFGETVEHSISTELTEEEAIAKYASMDVKLQEGNILLVLNDGERSESIPAFEVISLEILKGPDGKNFKIPKLKMLKFAYGGPSYSINIDHVFEDEVKRRLKLIPEDSFPYSLQCIADGLLETFQVFVRSETEALDDFEKIELRLPFVPREFYHADARIRDGRMLFTIGEIWCMYDKSLGSLFSFLNWLKSFKQISHLVISGNRISFPYVQKRVREYLGKEAQVNLIICKCPDLAVSNGLILDRMGSITQSLSSHGNT